MSYAERSVRIPFDQYELAATFHEPELIRKDDMLADTTLLICHGFVGNRIGVDRLFVKAARDLAMSGLTVVRFDYGGCGESEGDYGAGGLDLLVRQTREVIAFLRSRKQGRAARRILLLGHSLGGAVSVITASLEQNIEGLILWAPVPRPFADIVRIVGEAGYEEAVQYGRTDHRGYSLQESFFQSLHAYDPLQQAGQFLGDVLLLHGNRDEVIPLDSLFYYEREFRLRESGRCETEIIVRGDHTFSLGDAYQRLVGRTSGWLSSFAGSGTVAI
ncbi:alpha/beta hydrolase [Brevibacillus borstelensis]|uniref:alpha/beta hydrolase n=1 Tax=Brevibacillus borstelensis TaxID=45462 RepID=UPI0030BE8F2B